MYLYFLIYDASRNCQCQRQKLLCLLSFGCMWLQNREHTDPEMVSLLWISAVFPAVTAAPDRLFEHHGDRWVRPLCASGSFLMPNTLEDWMMQIVCTRGFIVLQQRTIAFKGKNCFYQSAVQVELLSAMSLQCQSLLGLRSQVRIQTWAPSTAIS